MEVYGIYRNFAKISGFDERSMNLMMANVVAPMSHFCSVKPCLQGILGMTYSLLFPQ